MSWWTRLWSGLRKPAPAEGRHESRPLMDGWKAETSDDGLRTWRDAEGALLSLEMVDEAALGLSDLSDEVAIQQRCRRLAERSQGGLIEVQVHHESYGRTVTLIYKWLDRPAYIFTGMLVMLNQGASQLWTVVAGERGTTGVREATITSELLNSGQLSIDEYQRTWAQDPYDPEYRAADRSVLRFVSDDARYDDRFPQHPLSKVRRVLAGLRTSTHAE